MKKQLLLAVFGLQIVGGSFGVESSIQFDPCAPMPDGIVREIHWELKREAAQRCGGKEAIRTSDLYYRLNNGACMWGVVQGSLSASAGFICEEE